MIIFKRIKYFIGDLFDYIKNIIKWSPILWKDKNYDYFYILEVLKFKIENTSEYIEKHKRYIGFERDVERMNTCVRLIDKIQNQSYEFECSSLLGKSTEEYIEKYPLTYKSALKSIDKNNPCIAYKMCEIRHKKALRILFRLLEENIENWWD